MLVIFSVVVNLPFTAEQEEVGWVGDPQFTQQVLGVLPLKVGAS